MNRNSGSRTSSPGDERISVAIPVYNGEQYLEEAIASVLAQTRLPDEFHVFDNASTDRTRAIAERVLGADAVRGADSNQGAAWNFRRAALESTGEYFAWLASDDRLLPSFLELAVKALRERPECMACLPAIRFVNPSGGVTGGQADPELAHDELRVRLRSFLRRPRWTEAYCLYRRAELLESPMLTSEFGSDVLLTWWILLRGPLVVLETPLLEYRVFPEKTLEDMGESLDPGSTPRAWRRMRLWRALWESAGRGVEVGVTRTARRELLLALVEKQWIMHNLADLRIALRRLARRPRTGGPR